VRAMISWTFDVVDRDVVITLEDEVNWWLLLGNIRASRIARNRLHFFG
jgi:hypothetical protein